MKRPFFTIGHSTLTMEAFVDLLRAGSVTCVVDVRSVPRSRTNPHYNTDTLPETLAGFQIGYEHVAELGGLRGKDKSVDPDLNGFWNNRSFHNYADYANTPTFRKGLDRLIELGEERRCAIMCAEAVWWRCHRRIVADYLLADGSAVFHLMGKDRVTPAEMTVAAVRSDDGLHYPAQASG